MSPPTVTITEATGEVSAVDPGIDKTIAIIGCCASGAAVTADIKTVTRFGTASGLYASRGEGPGTRLGGHILKKNPAKCIVAYCRVASSTPGSFATIDVTDVVGTALGANGGVPLGDYDLYFEVTDDGNEGAGTSIGTSGIKFKWSIDAGRTMSGTTSLGTAGYFIFPDTGCTLYLNPVASTLVVPTNALRTAVLAHFPNVTGSIHGAADSTSDDGIGAVCTTNANAITLINAIRAGMLLHFARGTLVHLVADTVNGVAIPIAATNEQEARILLNALIVAHNLHIVDLDHHGATGVADAVATTTPVAGTLKTGDIIQNHTIGPKWSTADLGYAFTALKDSSIDFGVVVIAGPVSAAEAATISAGCDTLAEGGKMAPVLFATRNMNSGESEETWLAAVDADFAALEDNRLAVCAVPARCTIDDGNRVGIFDTAGLPNIAARVMGVAKISESPSWVDAGAIEGVSLVDSAGNLLATAHDEGGDIQGLDSSHIITFRRLPDPTRRYGAYMTRPWVKFAAGDRIQFFPSRRVANKAERIAASISWGELGSAKNYIPGAVAGTGTLSAPAAAIMKNKIQASLASASGLRSDISNPDDPDLVTVDRNVIVSGEEITVPISLNVVLFKYVAQIDLTLNIRG